jgi:hypothetical protein
MSRLRDRNQRIKQLVNGVLDDARLAVNFGLAFRYLAG